MISTSAHDRLWSVIAEFGARARAHPGVVEKAILGFLEADVARHRAAQAGLADPLDSLAEAESQAMASRDFTDEEKRELRRSFALRRTKLAMQAGALYRDRMNASEPEVPSLDERIAYLARLHDLVVAEDRDGDRRESRRPLAPALAGPREEVAWELLVLPTALQRMRADLAEKGAVRASEYLAAVRAELPLPGEAGQP